MMKSIVVSLMLLVSITGILKGDNVLTTTNSTDENSMATQMKSWISNSTYWNGEADRENLEITRQIKSWMNRSTFWSNDTETSEPDLAFQIKSWMNDGAYWNESADQILGNNELASN